MPTNTSLTINSTQNGKKVTDKISYVNPNITTQQAVLLAQTINSLTNNAYISTTRQDTTDLDGASGKPAFNFAAFCTVKNPSTGKIAYHNFNLTQEEPFVTIHVSEITANSNQVGFALNASNGGFYWDYPTVTVTGSDLTTSWSSKTIYADSPWSTSTKLTLSKVEPCTLSFNVTVEETTSHQGALLYFQIVIVADEEPEP